MVKVRQVVVVKVGIIVPTSSIMPYVKVAIRWIDAEQHAVAKQIRAIFTTGFPVMGMPTATCSPVAVACNQRLAAGSTFTALPFPRFCYRAGRECHDNTSDIVVVWDSNGEDFWWSKYNGVETGVIITKITPYSLGEFTQTETLYHIRHDSMDKDIADTPSLSEAKRLAMEYLRRVL